MVTAYAMEEIKPGTLSAKITFHDSDLIGGSDFMDQADNGQRFTVRELIVPMIQVSDNTAANLLIAHFGVATINGVGKSAGMLRTRLARQFLDYSAMVHHNDNVSTPTDMGHLLYLIERGARGGRQHDRFAGALREDGRHHARSDRSGRNPGSPAEGNAGRQ